MAPAVRIQLYRCITSLQNPYEWDLNLKSKLLDQGDCPIFSDFGIFVYQQQELVKFAI